MKTPKVRSCARFSLNSDQSRHFCYCLVYTFLTLFWVYFYVIKRKSIKIFVSRKKVTNVFPRKKIFLCSFCLSKFKNLFFLAHETKHPKKNIFIFEKKFSQLSHSGILSNYFFSSRFPPQRVFIKFHFHFSL